MINEPTNNNTSPARLSDQERAEMRREFLSFMAHNLAAEAPARQVRSPYLGFLHSPIFYSLALFLVLGGTTYAAEGSLPQEPLYPIKTDVIEPLIVQVAPLAGVSKGRAHAAIVGRRLEEAETLIAHGDLPAQSARILADKISKSADNVQAYIADATQDGHLDDALDAGSTLETVLEAHETVLASVAQGQATSTGPATQDFIDTVADQSNEAQSASEQIEQQLTTASSTDTQEYVATLEQSATTTIGKLQESLAGTASDDSELASEAAGLLAQAQNYYRTGLDHAARSEYPEALSDLREAQSAADKGLILVKSDEALPAPDEDAQQATSSPQDLHEPPPTE